MGDNLLKARMRTCIWNILIGLFEDKTVKGKSTSGGRAPSSPRNGKRNKLKSNAGDIENATYEKRGYCSLGS